MTRDKVVTLIVAFAAVALVLAAAALGQAKTADVEKYLRQHGYVYHGEPVVVRAASCHAVSGGLFSCDVKARSDYYRPPLVLRLNAVVQVASEDPLVLIYCGPRVACR